MKRAYIPLVLMSLALVASAQESLTLRYNPQVGKTYRYSSEVKFSSNAMGTATTTKILSIQAIEITKLADSLIDSVAKMEFVRLGTSQPGAEQAMAKAAEEAKKDAITTQSDLLGTTVKTSTTGAAGMGTQMSQMNGLFGYGIFGLIFPKDPIAVGKGWTTDLDLKKIMGPTAAMIKDQKPITFTYTLKSISDVNGRKTAKIGWKVAGTLTMTAPTGAESAKMLFTGEGSSDVDVLTGLSLKNVGGMTIDIDANGGPNGQPVKMSQGFTIKTELLEPKKI